MTPEQDITRSVRRASGFVLVGNSEIWELAGLASQVFTRNETTPMGLQTDRLP
jgi:hypothetical protein